MHKITIELEDRVGSMVDQQSVTSLAFLNPLLADDPVMNVPTHRVDSSYASVQIPQGALLVHPIHLIWPLGNTT